MAQHSVKRSGLGLMVEIDQNITAKDQIKEPVKKTGVRLQVHSGKPYDAPCRLSHLNQTLLMIAAFQHEGVQESHGNLSCSGDRENRGSGLLQDPGWDVCSEHFQIPSRLT